MMSLMRSRIPNQYNKSMLSNLKEDYDIYKIARKYVVRLCDQEHLNEVVCRALVSFSLQGKY